MEITKVYLPFESLFFKIKEKFQFKSKKKNNPEIETWFKKLDEKAKDTIERAKPIQTTIIRQKTVKQEIKEEVKEEVKEENIKYQDSYYGNILRACDEKAKAAIERAKFGEPKVSDKKEIKQETKQEFEYKDSYYGNILKACDQKAKELIEKNKQEKLQNLKVLLMYHKELLELLDEIEKVFMEQEHIFKLANLPEYTLSYNFIKEKEINPKLLNSLLYYFNEKGIVMTSRKINNSGHVYYNVSYKCNYKEKLITR